MCLNVPSEKANAKDIYFATATMEQRYIDLTVCQSISTHRFGRRKNLTKYKDKPINLQPPKWHKNTLILFSDTDSIHFYIHILVQLCEKEIIIRNMGMFIIAVKVTLVPVLVKISEEMGELIKYISTVVGAENCLACIVVRYVYHG